MPPKPHFLTEAESTNLRAKHLIMPEEDQRWLQTHLDRINETMQYHIQGRTSMDDALRLFLMADKGFTLQQAIEMRDISPAQMKAYYQEFIETYANPEKTGEENMYLLGGMHSRALKKIQEFRFPNYHNVKSIADFTRVYAFFTVLNGIMTSLSQDTQISDPGLNLAYYAGAGGKSNLKKLAQPIDNACYQVTVMLQFLDYDKFDYPVDTTAQYLKLCKNQIVKYSNKTIGEMKIPVLFSNDAVQRIAFNDELMKPNGRGRRSPVEGANEYRRYLNGEGVEIPLSPAFEQEMSAQILNSKQDFSGTLTNQLESRLVNHGLEAYLSCPHPEDTGDARDIFSLSEEDQKKLQCTYMEMFDRGLSGVEMNVIYDMGLTEFDLIKVRGGETISQMVNRKYPNLDQETRFRAMIMETVRHSLTDGVVVMDLEYNPETGNYTLKNGIAIEAKKDEELRAEENTAMEEGLSATKAQREEMFRKEDGEIIDSVDELSPEQKERAAGMYDQIFGAAFNSINMRDYRITNPEKLDVDFFRVGGMSLRSFLGETKMGALMNAGSDTLKAEILRMSTDPKIPLSLSTVKYDALRNEYSDRTPIHIMDAEDQIRIRTEYTHLNTLLEYKRWMVNKYEELGLGQAAQTMLQSFDEETWIDMYHSEFHNAAVKGFTIPKEKVISPNQLAKRAEDPVNPHSQSFENLKTVYGPKPLVVEGWVGPAPGANIYTKDNFLQHSPELPQGNFTDGDFSLVAFYAALSPNVIVSNPYIAAPEEWISKEDQFINNASMWTMDIAAQYPKPRTNLGDAFLEKAIKPARIAASDMISAYESGNQEQMVGILSDGLKRMMNYMLITADLKNTSGPTAFKLHMLRKTNEMLDRYPGIRGEVMDRLTEEEKESLKVFLSLEDVLNQSIHAKARLDEAKKNEEALPPEELEALTKKVDAFNFYAASWEKNNADCLNTPEYKAYVEDTERAMIQRMYAAPGNTVPGDVRSAELFIYQMNHIQLAPDIKEALLSEDPLNAAQVIRGSGDHLEQYYNAEWQKLERAKAVLGRAVDGEQIEANQEVADQDEAGQNEIVQHEIVQEEVTPEACDTAVRDQEESKRRLESLRRLLESRLSLVDMDVVRDSYNSEARMHAWPDFQSFEENREELSPEQHPERYKCYLDQLIKYYKSNIQKCYRIEEEIDRIKIPTDPDFEVKYDQPLKKRFARWNRYFEKLSQLNGDFAGEDREVVRQAAEHLKEVKEDIAASITRANDLTAGNAIRTENMLRGTEGYNEDEKEFSGLLVKKNVGAGVPEVKVITEDAGEAYRRLLAEPPVISEALRNKGVTAIQMMQQRSMLEDVPGSRTMAHGRTVSRRTELAAAVERSPIQAIREADNRYIEAYQAEREVFDHIRDSFSADTWVPKNMTLTGEKKVPSEFILDPKVDSRMNAIWQVGMTAKRLGVSAEEFIQNPGLFLINNLRMKLAENGLSSMTEPGDDFISSVEKLYTKGRELSRGAGLKGKVLEGLSGTEYVEKAIGNLYMMEENPDRRKSLAAYTKKLSQLIDAAVERENAECTCVYQMMCSTSTADRKSKQALMEGLKSAFLSGSAIGKEHLPVPYTNGEGMEEERPVKYRDLLARKNAYAELTVIYKKTLPSAKASQRKEMKLLIQETMLDYLMAHPEDRDKKEYKNLEKLAQSADTEMEIAQPGNDAELRNRPKTKYNQWKQDFTAELRNLENRVVARDREVNNEILRLQQEAEAAARRRNPNRALAWEKMEQIETRIQERQNQLLIAWQKKEITETYFRARYDDLHEVLLNPGRKLKNPPKFTDKRNAEQYAEDVKMVSNRVNCSFGEGYLKSLDSFKEWKKGQWDANQNELAAYSSADWKKEYRKELFNDSKRRGTPNWIKEKNGEALGRIEERRLQRQQELAAQNNNVAQNNNAAQNNNIAQNNPAHQNNAGAHHAPGHRPGRH